MEGSKSIHKNFTINLMLLCSKQGSIAAVCRDLGMNRQQFNKYLSGASLPSPATLQKLSDYFHIDQRQLFEDPRTQALRIRQPTQQFQPATQSITELITSNIAQIVEGSDAGFLKLGCYNFFSPWLVDSTHCVRGVLLIYKLGSATCFMRYTKLQRLRAPEPHYGIGKHIGLVIENSGRTFLVGRNTRGLGEISLMSFGPSNMHNRGVLTGLGLLMTPWGEPFATRISARYIGDKSRLSAAVREAGVVPLAAIDDNGDLRKSLEAKNDLEVARLTPYDFFELYKESLAKPAKR